MRRGRLPRDRRLFNVDLALEDVDATVAVGRNLHAELRALIDKRTFGRPDLEASRGRRSDLGAYFAAFQPRTLGRLDYQYGRGLDDHSHANVEANFRHTAS